MKKCTFFGHKNTPPSVIPLLKKTIAKLIEDDVVVFYVGTQGQFDSYCYRILKDLKTTFPKIRVYRVLAYMPTDSELSEDSIYPQGIEETPKRFAISYRNRWMIDRCDYVVSYVAHSASRAYRFGQLAKRKGKKVINIA